MKSKEVCFLSSRTRFVFLISHSLHPFPLLHHQRPGQLNSIGSTQWGGEEGEAGGLRDEEEVSTSSVGGVVWEGCCWRLNSSILSHVAGSNQLRRLEPNSELLLFALAPPTCLHLLMQGPHESPPPHPASVYLPIYPSTPIQSKWSQHCCPTIVQLILTFPSSLQEVILRKWRERTDQSRLEAFADDLSGDYLF